MQAVAESSAMLALFGLGGWEIVLILAVVLILWGARKLPGPGRGISEFCDASKRVIDEIDQGAIDAGRSVGGIHGKAAAQALTHDNHVAELYDPTVFQETPRHKRRERRITSFMRLWRWLLHLARAILSGRR